MPTSVFQLRADHELLQEVKEIASKRQVSANRYLQGSARRWSSKMTSPMV